MGIKYFRPEVLGSYVSMRTLLTEHALSTSLSFQSLKSARAYCCAIGMKLATFQNKALLQDAFDAVQYR
jgi:hypothetical protein